MGMIVNSVAYKNGERVSDIGIEDITEVLKQEDTFIWLGLHEPNELLLQQIQEVFSLHELAVEDAHQAHQRPKFEAYGDSLFIVLQTAQFWEGNLHFGETHLFLGKRFFVSIRHGASLPYVRVRQRCEEHPDLFKLGPAVAMYAVMDFIVDNYAPVVEAFESDLHAIEADVFSRSFNRTTIERLYGLQRQLVELRLVVVPVIDICNHLMHFHQGLIPDAVRPYFRDISDHAARINEAIDTMREMLAAAIAVNMSLVTIGQNEIVKRLAGWGAILAIPTIVFSLYGMNFEHMPELRWRWGYPGILAGLAIVCVWLYQRLKRAGWL